MDPVCHRCDGDLSLVVDARFCPLCGAPQLRLSSAVIEETDTLSGATDGTLPPQGLPQRIEWSSAMRAALAVSSIAVLLFLLAAPLPIFSFPALLWAGAASLLTLEIYGRRHAATRIDAAVGARIGASVGVLMVSGFGLVLAIAGTIARFTLHRMGHFDLQLRQAMAEQVTKAAVSNPAAASLLNGPSLPGMIGGSLLLGLLIAGLFLFAISVAGGALGGAMRGRRAAR